MDGGLFEDKNNLWVWGRRRIIWDQFVQSSERVLVVGVLDSLCRLARRQEEILLPAVSLNAPTERELRLQKVSGIKDCPGPE